MKKLALSLLLLTPAVGVATVQNLDPIPECFPCKPGQPPIDQIQGSPAPVEAIAALR